MTRPTDVVRLTREREAAGLTRARLGADANIHPARVGQFENQRAVPYPVELARIAAVLHFEGDPDDLLEVVSHESA
jgi:transcriptional regulator with XRE-family HTH domain